MAKKDKTHYRCNNCEYTQIKWSGRCPECGQWNSLEEVALSSSSLYKSRVFELDNKILTLSQVEGTDTQRISTRLKEVDQVLGGGLVLGSVILLGGEPGIGKSTLLLQIANQFSVQGNVLYVSGEESLSQVKMRATRLELTHDMKIYSGSDLDGVLGAIEKVNPKLMVVDSVQTLYDVELGLTPGTINQVKRCAHAIVQAAKERDIVLFLVAHVTKDGAIAGPKVIEHLVDTVLYFEQGESDLRLLRAVKNRFGAVDELGVFSMTQRGLQEMSYYFYQQFSQKESVVGSSMVAVLEGSRTFFHEIQALTVKAKSNFSRIYSEHIDTQKVARICAILEKYLNLSFVEYDIYIHVSGGVRLRESAIDLAIALALYSARLNILLPHTLVASGELTLAGGVRWANHLSKRLKFAEELHFRHFVSGKIFHLPLANSQALEVEGQSTERANSLVELIREVASLGG